MSLESGSVISGRYRVTRQLGQGGMGIVYEAHDLSLDRPVALKYLTGEHDAEQLSRLQREARAAASISHPNICHVYEIGGQVPDLYIAMELLDGESLASRIARDALAPTDALRIAAGILKGVEALHNRQLIHRDLKPSNVFLTTHAVKLLDFGLARAVGWDATVQTAALTVPGTILGSPAYMSPEQARGEELDRRADLFSVGVVLFEMLTGRSPFLRATPIETLHAVIHEHPPALGGSAGVIALDRVIRRALAKDPRDRYSSAAQMIAAIEEAERSLRSAESAHHQMSRAVAVTRLVVVPFRLLRPDEEIDFLPFGLADAISMSLAGLSSLVVRSSMSVMKAGSSSLDLRALAREIDVDVVLTGTLLRAGDRLRLNAQLVSATDESILWSQTLQVSLGDVFQLQDDLCQRIVESLALPLNARDERQLRQEAPASTRAYELYLRANNVFYHAQDWTVARELYVECLREDPNYAPAWARLGRCYRLTAKFQAETEDAVKTALRNAEDAFERALTISPDLPLAHHLYTVLECDLGRAPAAMRRLLTQASRRLSDPELFAGLVHACRYAGLPEASFAANERATQLDARVSTSVANTYAITGDWSRALLLPEWAVNWYFRSIAMFWMGRPEKSLALLRERGGAASQAPGRALWYPLLALLEGRKAECIALLDAMLSLNSDPESRYYFGSLYAPAGAPDRALETIRTSVEMGYCCAPALKVNPWIDDLRRIDGFRDVADCAEALRVANVAVFDQAGGARILGMGLR